MKNCILVSTRKGLFTIKRNQSGWNIAEHHFPGVNSSMVLHDQRDNTVYAALGHGHFGVKLHRSGDEGRTWQELKPPAYPELPPENLKGKEGKPPSLELIWSLETGGLDEPGVIWCGTIPGAILRSPDRGETWEFNRPLWDDPRRKNWFGGGYDSPGIDSIAVDPRNSRHIVVAASVGGVWITEDGGANWRCEGKGMRADYLPPSEAYNPAQQDPHRMVQCPAQPDVLWIQHHNGVFRSSDGGANWVDVKAAVPSSFGFTAAVHPRDPDTAWFVPAQADAMRIPKSNQVVVSRTRDGGKTFEILRRGLPQEYAFDLVFRHSLDVDDSGDRLAFGSTTGSFWVSEDGGDSWQTISNHLPPVYCVRFTKG